VWWSCVKDPTFWILARASGLTAYVLLTIAMLAGLVVKSRPFGARVRAAAVTDTHRFLTLLALGAIALHGFALTLDSTVRIRLPALLVPGLSPYRPTATALGVLAAELAAVIVVSFPLRKRIGARLWRRLHWATYGVFAAATVHGLAAGTDSSRPWVFAIYLGSVAAVVFATAWRVLARPARPSLQGGPHAPNRNRPQPV
jgi:methionine sulfoxide reductase heme-binding subunit